MLKWSKVKAEIIYLKEFTKREDVMMNATTSQQVNNLRPAQFREYSSSLIADYILFSGAEKGKGFDRLKLLKLVYIAHGFFLALHERPLVSEPVEAWQYGPVFRDLYLKIVDKTNSNQVTTSLVSPKKPELDTDACKVIDKVMDAYCDLDGVFLSFLTHKQGTPWTETYQAGKNVIIPNDLIKIYYKGVYGRYYQELYNSDDSIG